MLAVTLEDLRNRLKAFSIRTLRRQVVEYIQYTERRLITRPFKPDSTEHKLYEAVSAFLQRPETYALPQRQRHLTALVVRKLLASSPLAVAATLEAMRDRLIAIRDTAVAATDLVDRIVADEKIEEEILDEIFDGEPEAGAENAQQIPIDLSPTSAPAIDPQRLQAEIDEPTRYTQWARSIGIDTKSRALVTGFVGFVGGILGGRPINSLGR